MRSTTAARLHVCATGVVFVAEAPQFGIGVLRPAPGDVLVLQASTVLRGEQVEQLTDRLKSCFDPIDQMKVLVLDGGVALQALVRVPTAPRGWFKGVVQQGGIMSFSQARDLDLARAR